MDVSETDYGIAKSEQMVVFIGDKKGETETFQAEAARNIHPFTLGK